LFLDFATASRIRFGCGVAFDLPVLFAELLADREHTLFAVVGLRDAPSGPILDAMRARGHRLEILRIGWEPTVDDAREGLSQLRASGAEAILAIGGGSVLDLGKALAGLATNEGDPLDYLEVVGLGRPLTRPALPLLALPTTAGTGSEVTRNAVLRVPEHGVKASLRSPFLLPLLALVDPALTLDLPAQVTASTGFDALAQLLEPFVCTRANPLTDGFCREGLPRVARSLRRAVQEPGSIEAREDLSLAALLGGLALANAGLGAAHGFAAVLGGTFGAPHGALCARLLGPVTRANLEALEQCADRKSLLRYQEAASLLEARGAWGLPDALEALCHELAIPWLRAFGVGPEHVEGLVSATVATSSMKANPVRLSHEALARVLLEAI
jgi:alcohol dehydrogenase class IV